MARNVGSRARAILDEFQREGHISPASLESANFGVYDRLTPGWIILMAFKLAILFRSEGEGLTAAQIAPELESELDDRETRLIVSSILGDVESLREAQRRELIDLEKITTLLDAAIRNHSIPDEKIDLLIEMAEEECREALESGDLPAWRLAARGVQTGPWDASEREACGPEHINFGGLWIPVSPDVELTPIWLDSELAGIVIERHGTTLRLQAFHGRSWDATRSDWRSDAHARGGHVTEWAGTAGLELRGSIPQNESDGPSEERHVRVIGCDGPNWMLYGVIRGRGASPESSDKWAYEVFENTVVDASFSGRAAGERIKLRLPDDIIASGG